MGRTDVRKYITLENRLVWRFKCPKCGKIIESLYKDQVMQQAAQHILAHQLEKVKKEKKEE